MEKKNLILNRILDEVFDACKQCIVDNYEEDDERLKKLKARVRYEMTEENAKMTDKEFDGLLFEALDFLNSGFRISKDYDKCMIAKLIDDLFNDQVFQKYDKIYKEEGKIDKKLLILLTKRHKELLNHLELTYVMKKNNLINTKYSDDDMMYLFIYNEINKKRLAESLKMINESLDVTHP